MDAQHRQSYKSSDASVHMCNPTTVCLEDWALP